MKKVCCIGIAVADVVVKPVNHLPEKGKLDLVDSIDLYTGGCAVNVAIDLAKIGVDTSICGLVGEDSFGDFITNELSKNGIDIQGIQKDSDAITSSSIVISNSDGERSFLHNIGTNGVFNLEHINWKVIEESDIVVVTGALLMPEFDGKQTAEFLKKAQEMGKYTVLDTAWDSKGRWMELIEPCLPFIDLFIPSIEEAEELSGEKLLDKIAGVFLCKGAKNVVLKLGSEGCYVNCSGEVFTEGIFKVTAVDTNGAGDSFVSGFVAGLVNGFSYKQCALFANAVGAHCVQAVGASTGIPNKETLINYIKTHKGEF